MNKTRNEIAAPLGSATAGRLEFIEGADNIIIRADAAMDHLYRARFEGNAPDVRVEDGLIEIEYPWNLNPFDWRRQSAEIALNARIPWRIEVAGGLSRLEANLSGLRLEDFEIGGGANNVELTLPQPSGAVSIRIKGGANNVRVRRPGSVATRVRLGGGASKLALDDQYLGGIGGEVTLESSGYAGATNRYEITVTGGANNVSVTAP